MKTQTGKIIVFRIMSNKGHRVANRFVQRLYGQDTTSQKGKYKYHKKGLLEDIPHIRLIRGVIIVPDVFSDQIEEFMGEFGAEFYIRNVVLEKDDKRKLG